MLHGCHFILAQTGHGGSNAKARAVKKHACYSRGSQNTCRGNPTQTAAINAQLQSSTLTVSTYCTHFVAKSRIGRPQQQLGPGARLCAQPAGPVQGLTLTSELPTCQGMPGDVTDPFKRQAAATSLFGHLPPDFLHFPGFRPQRLLLFLVQSQMQPKANPFTSYSDEVGHANPLQTSSS